MILPESLEIDRQNSGSPTEQYSPDFSNYNFDVSPMENDDRPPEYDSIVTSASVVSRCLLLWTTSRLFLVHVTTSLVLLFLKHDPCNIILFCLFIGSIVYIIQHVCRFFVSSK